MSRDYFGSWRQILKPGELAELARDAGFGERASKLSPRRTFWGLTLGFGSGPKRTIAGLARFVGHVSGVVATRQALQQRLSEPEAADFFRRCLARLTHRCATLIREPLPGKLSTYEDCKLLDSTTLALADRLAQRFPACRTNVRKAALKLHTRMSLRCQHAESVGISGDRLHDRKGVAVGPWVRDQLLFFDLAYLDYEFLGQIVAEGGAFCSRLKTTSNGTIISVREGSAPHEEGRSLKEAAFQDEVVDLDVLFGEGSKTILARVVGLWDPETKEYHWYATSLDPKEFSPQEVGQSYRLRWQIELLFKQWKSLLRLAQLPSANEEVVLCLIYATLCAAALSRLVLWFAARRYKLSWYEMSTVVAILVIEEYAAALAGAAIRGRGGGLRPILAQVMEGLAAHAHRPNDERAFSSFAAKVA